MYLTELKTQVSEYVLGKKWYYYLPVWLFGLYVFVELLKGRSYFTVLICCLWFMLTCQSVGVYMADARVQQLPLMSVGGALSGSDTAIHDWNFIFGTLHMLPMDTIYWRLRTCRGDYRRSVWVGVYCMAAI